MSWILVFIFALIIMALIGIIIWLWLKLKKYPISSFTFSPSSASVGQTVTYTNKSMNATKYIWEFGDGLTMENSVNATHIYSNPGTYIISLIAINGELTSILKQTITVS